ncbi:HyuE hydantoin racemase [Salipiger aestuarii]|uniref:Allantoin racemase n=1 Tax=Salipiger aestuarii TaxID=568098 RepID=A0A327XP03_9RHOB|nr:aspartate/glutamate racemase family protein [Salipiger aestuarii]EIE52722.1 Asp/Glu racemase [Citreicella sp. 357]KAA8605538.1 HyuE hydantoin racemase [Salipiger aestuarii]KAB2539648.1 HyuE hydantoin racemase [Salipiger aestuarii]RAK10443.1 allantoin racemase [Salipiger aestuarii]
MRLLYVNPNATVSMTGAIVAAARAALPGARISGETNATGPMAIQGAQDGAAAIPGVLDLLSRADADAAVIACFDDTGLEEAQARVPFPVLGIGQSAYVMAGLMGRRFSVVTSLAVSVPVIEHNIARGGFAARCVSVRASGLPVLTIDEGGAAVLDRLSHEIARARDEGAGAVVLGCAGMAPLTAPLAARTGVVLIDGVAASAHLAAAAAGFAGGAERRPGGDVSG